MIQTNHEANIFGVAFLPHSNNSLIASCAGDCQVQLYSAHQLSSSGGSDAMVRNWGCHVGRVKSLAVEPNTPSLIWTASEDATVRQFDTRDDHTCRSLSDSSRDYDAECPSILINLREEVPSNTVKSVAVNAAFPNYMAIGCDDGTVRLYDRYGIDFIYLAI